MFYFKREALVPSLESLSQLQKTLEFKARVEKLGLTAEFDDADDFERLVRRSPLRRSRAMHVGKQASIASVRMHLPPGWEAKMFSQAPGHREDFIALNGDVAYRVSARFALPKDSSLVKKSVERLARGEDDPAELDGKPIALAGRIVVVPDATSVPQGEGAGGVWVVKQCELAEALPTPSRTPV